MKNLSLKYDPRANDPEKLSLRIGLKRETLRRTGHEKHFRELVKRHSKPWIEIQRNIRLMR